MSTKSFVGMGHYLCPVCMKEHDTVVLIDKRVKNSLDRDNYLGWSLCEEHQSQLEEGYVFLIEVSNDPQQKSTIKLEELNRTGNYAAIRRTVFERVFNQLNPQIVNVVEVGVLDSLKEMQNDSETAQEKTDET